MEKIQELKLNDAIGLESYYEEREYHKMWLYYKSIYIGNTKDKED